MKNWKQIKTLLVGGAVRDYLMNIPPSDEDLMVLEQTTASMIELGFKRVGKSPTCPVFIHPNDKHRREHALPRSEQSTGKGHKDFSFTTEDVTVHKDLSRRDFTINAMAACFGPDGKPSHIEDPFGGQRDIENKILRHVGPAFIEDPLRVLRAARFAARFNFDIAPYTVALCKDMCRNGSLASLPGERILLELNKAINSCRRPSLFFDNLIKLGALRIVFPEIAAMLGVEQPQKHHIEGDVYTHTMMALDHARSKCLVTPVCLAVLFHDIGKTLTPPSEWPSHHNHCDANAQAAMAETSKRLRMDNRTATLCMDAVKFHMKMHKFNEMTPGKIAKMFREIKVKQDTFRACLLRKVLESDMAGRIPLQTSDISDTWGSLVAKFHNHKIKIPNDKQYSTIAKKNIALQQEVDCIKKALTSINRRKDIK